MQKKECVKYRHTDIQTDRPTDRHSDLQSRVHATKNYATFINQFKFSFICFQSHYCRSSRLEMVSNRKHHVYAQNRKTIHCFFFKTNFSQAFTFVHIVAKLTELQQWDCAQMKGNCQCIKKVFVFQFCIQQKIGK